MRYVLWGHRWENKRYTLCACVLPTESAGSEGWLVPSVCTGPEGWLVPSVCTGPEGWLVPSVCTGPEGWLVLAESVCTAPSDGG